MILALVFPPRLNSAFLTHFLLRKKLAREQVWASLLRIELLRNIRGIFCSKTIRARVRFFCSNCHLTVSHKKGTFPMDDLRILIVDDDTALLQALPQAIALRMKGVNVDACDSAQGALQLAQENEYYAIVSDI